MNSQPNVAPAPGWTAAQEGALLVHRTDLQWWTVTGRDPGRMLKGVVTGTMPLPLSEAETGGRVGLATPQAILTPKGRMVAVLELASEVASGERLVALVPAAAAPGLQEHLGRYLPPRFAKAQDRSSEVGVATLAGPDAAELVTRLVFGLRVEAAELLALEPGGIRVADEDGAEGEDQMGIWVMRSGEVDVPAFHLIAPTAELDTLMRLLREAGAHPGDLDDLMVLRVEAGQPAFGLDMDDGVIPTEAGIEDRVIDHAKGCYTGQEVIVRIRDRGHVNRRLRRVTLGEMPVPPESPQGGFSSRDLFITGREKPAAELRSVVRSPRFNQTVGLAYLRRDAWDGEGEQPVLHLEPVEG